MCLVLSVLARPCSLSLTCLFQLYCSSSYALDAAVCCLLSFFLGLYFLAFLLTLPLQFASCSVFSLFYFSQSPPCVFGNVCSTCLCTEEHILPSLLSTESLASLVSTESLASNSLGQEPWGPRPQIEYCFGLGFWTLPHLVRKPITQIMGGAVSQEKLSQVKAAFLEPGVIFIQAGPGEAP